MTSILGASTMPYALQVGDRLLTMPSSQGPREWDAVANKSILLLTPNGTLSISYSGLAYIRGVPTDQWIAEALHGEKFAAPDGRLCMQAGNFIPRLGPAIQSLVAAIQRDFFTLPYSYRRHQLQVLATGWTWKRRVSSSRLPRPLAFRIICDGASRKIRSDILPRHWRWDRGLIQLSAIGGDERGQRERTIGKLGLPTDLTADVCESILVDAVRSLADIEPTVGRSCMSLLIHRDQEVRVRFLPDPEKDDQHSAYTPWVLGYRIVMPPQVLKGWLPSLNTGPFKVSFDRYPPLPPARFGSSSTQVRRASP